MLLICKSTKSELIYIYCRRSVNGNKRSCIKIRILTKTLAPGRGNLGGGGRLRERRDGGAGRGGGSWGERCSGTHSFRFFKRGFLNERFHYKEDGTSHILHLSDGRYKFVLFSMLQSNASCKLNSPQKLMKPKDTIGQKVRYYLLIC